MIYRLLGGALMLILLFLYVVLPGFDKLIWAVGNCEVDE